MTTWYATAAGASVTLTATGYDLRRTRDFYHPYYALSTDPPHADPVAHVHVTCTGRDVGEVVTAMGEYLAPSAPVRVDRGPGADELLFPRPVPDVVVRVSRARRRIEITGDHPTHVELQTRTLVRDQLLGQLERAQGWVVFHAAAAACGEAGVVFLGHRNAGKTSSLVALMSTGRYDFLSADRVKLCAGPEFPLLRGVPARCNLHRIALESDPFLRPLATGRRYDREGKCLVDVADLVRLAGVEHVPAASLRAVVLPELRPEHPGLAVERLHDRDQVRARLAEYVMEGTPADKHVHWLHYLPDTAASLPDRLTAVADQLVGTVPVIAVRSSYQTYVDAIRDGSFDPLRFADSPNGVPCLRRT